VADSITVGDKTFLLPNAAFRGWTLDDTKAWLEAVTAASVSTELVDQVPATSAAASKVRFRANGSKLQVSENGGRWRRVLGGDELHDVRDYVQSGDTAAQYFQRTLDVLSKNRSTGSGGTTGKIFIPSGNYAINSTLQWGGGPIVSLQIFGDMNGNGPSGTNLVWTGAADGTLMYLQGMVGGGVTGVNFTGGGLAGKLLWINYFANNGNAGSQICVIDRCGFGMDRSGAIGLALGNVDIGAGVYQTSEIGTRRPTASSTCTRRASRSARPGSRTSSAIRSKPAGTTRSS
jgi:hypothetical protein